MITGAKGSIKAETEDGFVADFTHPLRVTGVKLPRDALCQTRDYSSLGSRTRITKHHVPGQEVHIGDDVTAIVEGEVSQRTGRMLVNPNRHASWREPYEIPEVMHIGGSAVRWGINSSK